MTDTVENYSAGQFRSLCREGKHSGPTAGFAMGYVQANLVILPKPQAYDFLVFCQRNPKPCPLIEVTDPGDPTPRVIAADADLRTDLPRYRIYRDGKLAEETTDIVAHWRDDFVAFLLGCSFTFESALLQAGLPVRHIEERDSNGQPKNVPMYRTNIACRPSGMFHGPLVVSMRPFRPADAIEAATVTARFPQVHGSPIHLGDPTAIGIADINRPDWGDAVTIHHGEIPVFWACGVTPQAVVMESKPEVVITHAPGHMFVSDLKDSELLGR